MALLHVSPISHEDSLFMIYKNKKVLFLETG